MFGGSLLEHVTWTKSLANSSNVLKDHVLVRLMPAKLREADADLVLLWTLDPRFAKEI